jgi:hypothetical protein
MYLVCIAAYTTSFIYQTICIGSLSDDFFERCTIPLENIQKKLMSKRSTLRDGIKET